VKAVELLLEVLVLFLLLAVAVLLFLMTVGLTVCFSCVCWLQSEVGALVSRQLHTSNGVNDEWRRTPKRVPEIFFPCWLQQWLTFRSGDSCREAVCSMLSTQV